MKTGPDAGLGSLPSLPDTQPRSAPISGLDYSQDSDPRWDCHLLDVTTRSSDLKSDGFHLIESSPLKGPGHRGRKRSGGYRFPPQSPTGGHYLGSSSGRSGLHLLPAEREPQNIDETDFRRSGGGVGSRLFTWSRLSVSCRGLDGTRCRAGGVGVEGLQPSTLVSGLSTPPRNSRPSSYDSGTLPFSFQGVVSCSLAGPVGTGSDSDLPLPVVPDRPRNNRFLLKSRVDFRWSSKIRPLPVLEYEIFP